jgi:hypothetical protein
MPFRNGFHYTANKQWRNYGRWKSTFGKYRYIISIGTMRKIVASGPAIYDTKEEAESAAIDQIDTGELDHYKSK